MRFVVQRVLLGILTLWIVSVIVFAATQALPGDAALIKLTRNETPEALAAIRHQLNLDKSVVAQYWLWLKDTASGDLGSSFVTGLPVSDVIGDRLTNTVVLVLGAALIAFPLALIVGIWSAIRRDRLADHVLSVGTLIAASLPEFVLAIALILLLATNVFSVFPAVSTLDSSRSILAQLDLVALPAITLAISTAPYVARMIRASMIEVLESDYVAMARLKGLPARRVIVHALMNASGPSIQAGAIALVYLAGGVVVIEAVFRFPGLGSALIDAVQSRDLPVIQAVALAFASVYVVVNIVADLLTIFVTPKVRTATR